MRVLFLTPRPPWPGRRGDQVRSAGLAGGLAARGHEVHVLCQQWPGLALESPPPRLGLASFEAVEISGAKVIAAGLVGALTSPFTREPIQARLHRHTRFERAVLRAVETIEPDVVVVVLSRLGSVQRAIRRRFPDLPVVLDLVDALGANMRRRGEREKWLAPLWRREAARLDAWDARLVADSAAATVVAERDRGALLEAKKAPPAERLHVLPFGLDVPGELPTESSVGETVVLTGNLGYFPTVEGARYFAREVWPQVRLIRPGARWILAGARPSKAVRDLARLEGVELLADPPDLGPIVAGATVSIAPLRAGSGTPIKILEAMAAGVPVVTTPAGRDGLDQLPEGAVSVADSAGAFAEQVASLLADPARRRAQAEIAHRWLRERHHLPRVAERFEALLEGVAAGGSPRPG